MQGPIPTERDMASIFDQRTLDFISHSEAQTRRLGARLGELLQGGEVIALQGALGSGKTRWVQGLAQGLGVQEPVTSPTFTLIHEYHGRHTLYHIDMYRITQLAEALDLGLEDYLYGDGVCVIEWAERIAAALPRDHLWITLYHLDETKRRIVMHATGERHFQLLKDFHRLAFAVPIRHP
ncbi:MAG: tRNA (adenosine(37)-N6)-threonylcarbamoyltransferase complex ATPase subunit type 1 TsaE [Anaerolineae bacterium]|nr:tRNA (adenosine(37)-N6)-threonylcarbamoyltransferase complex ATPase subunit type 1 TsaE [Anaerolineae bacterium]MDW8071459.1 tRNA (adenosine(37)-N6)-threonylcarbamoyltransferase complex ATPase subunit type 1 TsaE [Anaerolineae bacterium]